MKKSILLLCVLCLCSAANVLSSADFTNFQSSGNSMLSNFVGIGVNFSQVYTSAMNTTLFQALLANSKAFGSINSMFSISLKMQWPKGYKYNCASYTSIGISTTCTYSYSTILAKVTAFAKAAAPVSNNQMVIGFDMESANFSNSNFMTYFQSFCGAIASSVGSGFYVVPIELFDGADLFSANSIQPNYTATNFVNDINTLLAQNNFYTYYGPGVTQAADPSWLSTYNSFKNNPNFAFTVKSVIFNNTNSFTIDDLLNEANYRNYILQRFTYNGQVLNPAGGTLIISELKITNGLGIDGVTNSFASALWAIDFALEFAMFGGRRVYFPCDISTGSLQTILGPSPTFTPTPLYYGLLFLSMIAYVQPVVGVPLITAGSSSSIKIYGCIVNTQMQIVLINKDTNPNSSGVVQIKANSNDYARCLYLSAPSLSSTSGVSWAGYNFIAGSSVPQGSYSQLKYFLHYIATLVITAHISSLSIIHKLHFAILEIQAKIFPPR